MIVKCLFLDKDTLEVKGDQEEISVILHSCYGSDLDIILSADLARQVADQLYKLAKDIDGKNSN